MIASRVLPGQAQDSTLTRLIRQHQYPLSADSTHFAGPGWEKLRASVQRSQVVLVGEAHGLAQVPRFTAALAQVLQPTAFVAEIDFYVAQTLTRLSAQPGQAALFSRPMIRCVVMDDEPPALAILADYSGQVLFLTLAGTTTDPVEGLHNYVLLHSPRARSHLPKILKELAGPLPQLPFRRVRKSFIVSLNPVRLLDGNPLCVQDKLLPISDTYREALYCAARGN